MELIPRKDYLRQLRTFRDTQLIKVITGVRRCGKTTLMTLFINELKAGGIEDERIVRINFEDYDAIELTDPKALHAYLKSKLQEALQKPSLILRPENFCLLHNPNFCANDCSGYF